MKTYISKTDLAVRLGRTENTIGRWMKQGCPYITKVNEGRGYSVRPFFNLKEVKAWLLEQYKTKQGN